MCSGVRLCGLPLRCRNPAGLLGDETSQSTNLSMFVVSGWQVCITGCHRKRAACHVTHQSMCYTYCFIVLNCTYTTLLYMPLTNKVSSSSSSSSSSWVPILVGRAERGFLGLRVGRPSKLSTLLNYMQSTTEQTSVNTQWTILKRTL